MKGTTLKNGFVLDLQIYNEEHGTTEECVHWLGLIDSNKLPRWSDEEKKTTRIELIDLIEWRDALIPTVVNYIDNFGVNFPSDFYFWSCNAEDKRFVDYTQLKVWIVNFGYEKNTIEIKLKIA